jgi:competence protein ComEC
MIHRFPFFRILLAFAGGIYLGRLLFFQRFINTSPALFLLLLAGIHCLHFRQKNETLTAFFVTLFLIMTGIYRYQTFNRLPDFQEGTHSVAVILEYPVEKPHSLKTEAHLVGIIQKDTVVSQREKIVLYFEPDLRSGNLVPGEKVIFRGCPRAIRNNGNPHEFDYRQYMANQRIYRQAYLSSGQWTHAGFLRRFHVRVFAEKLRHQLLNTYRENHLTDKKFAILAALTLGYKDALDPETKMIYTSAGAMHVLAVSGLHVGILFVVIHLLTGFLRRTPKGRVVFVFLVITLLWIYALITGLSPSVLRATGMVGILVLGQNLRRTVNHYNTLALSAFLLLLFNPNLFFEAGFQLSYAAVTGIVFFIPRFQKLAQPRNPVLRWAWELFALSVAAQLATFPLVLHYFHQFPFYFWISGFIVIPGAFILICLGIGIMVTTSVPFLSSILSGMASGIVDATVFLLEKIHRLPFSVIPDIQISQAQCILLLLALVLFMLFLSFKQARYLFALLAVLIAVFSLNVLHKAHCAGSNKLIVYNAREGILIHLISGPRNYILYENESQPASYDMETAYNNIRALHLSDPVVVPLDRVYEDEWVFLKKPLLVFKEKKVWLTDSENQLVPALACDILLTRYEMKNTTGIAPVVIQVYGYPPEKEPSDEIFYLKNQGAYCLNF